MTHGERPPVASSIVPNGICVDLLDTYTTWHDGTCHEVGTRGTQFISLWVYLALYVVPNGKFHHICVDRWGQFGSCGVPNGDDLLIAG